MLAKWESRAPRRERGSNRPAYDGVIDFDKATRDPSDPKIPRGLTRHDPHPNDAGYKAMADAVDPALFSSQQTPARTCGIRKVFRSKRNRSEILRRLRQRAIENRSRRGSNRWRAFVDDQMRAEFRAYLSVTVEGLNRR
jgi:hypothetical protein